MWQAQNLLKSKHCFLGCKGGVSLGKYKGLNVNTKSQDDIEHVKRNLDIAASVIGLRRDNLLLLNQGISDKVVFVEQASHDVIEADGAVTNIKNVGLCIRTADCAPVLFEDRISGVIGVAHAGWRGAFKGIIANVVKMMLEKGAKLENIAAAVGPCIGQKSYEVDINFYNQFLEKSDVYAKYFVNGMKKNHYLFDLQSFCVDQIKNAGIENIEVSDKDTYELENEYYSFRRFTHQGIIDTPKDFATELSVIVL